MSDSNDFNLDNDVSNELETHNSVADSPRRKNKVGKIYKQFYRKAWEEVPEFKEWLTSIPDQRSLAYCKICQKTLHAHRLSLTKHTVSLKHTRLAQKKASQEHEKEMKCEGSGQADREMEEATRSQGVEALFSGLAPPAQQAERGGLSTHVLDVSKGVPAAGLAVSLYQLVEGRWTLVKDGQTNGDGRCNLLVKTGVTPGRYKLHFDTDRYFVLHRQATFFPFVEVVFDVSSPDEKNHVPLLLSPYGYSTYKGS